MNGKGEGKNEKIMRKGKNINKEKKEEKRK